MSNVTIRRTNEAEYGLPIFSELARRMDAVRQKAFELFERRGSAIGRELDDWLAAEHEVLGWPAAKMKEDEAAFEVEVTLPGFAAKEVEVTATPERLIVHAATETKKEGESERIVWSEFGANDVYRQFGFPQAVNADKVSARLENGILRVRAPKTEPTHQTRVPINA